MLSRRFALPVVLLLLVAAGVVAQDNPRPAALWKPLLDWLPEDTETLIVAQIPYEIRPPSTTTSPNPLQRIRFHETVPHLASASHRLLTDGLPYPALAGLKVLCAVEGSRRFREPNTKRNLGAFRYEGVHILCVAAADDAVLKKALQTCLDKADKKLQLAGEPVAEFRTQDPEAKEARTDFLCRPRPGVFVHATDRAYLEETLKRLDKKPAKRALPADLPEWKHVDVTAGVWAVRHYRKDTAKDDPTSPLEGGMLFGTDPDAVGFVFWYDSHRNAQIRYLTGAKNATDMVRKGLREQGSGFRPRMREATPGVVEMTARVGHPTVSPEFFLILMSCLGHGAFL